MMVAAMPYWRLSGFYFLYFAFLGTWVPYWNLYLKSLDYSSRTIGLLSAIMLGTKIISPALWGYLADRSSNRMAVIRGGSLAAACAFAMIVVQQPLWLMALAILLYSFFWNAVMPQFEVVTLSYLDGQHTRYSRIRLWGSIGFIFAVGGFGLVFDQLAIKSLPFFLFALLAGIAASSYLIREKKSLVAKVAAAEGILRIARQKPVLAFLASCFLIQLSHGPYYTFFSIYLEQQNYSHASIGALWSLGVIAEVVLFVFMPRLMTRFSLRQFMLAVWILTTLRWLLIGFFVGSLPLLLFAQCLHAASFACFHATAIELTRRFFPPAHQGQGQALYSSSYGAGAAAGAVMAGVLWDVSPVVAFATAAGVTTLALLICWVWLRGPLLAGCNELDACKESAI